jgi:hypothetical protein
MKPSHESARQRGISISEVMIIPALAASMETRAEPRPVETAQASDATAPASELNTRDLRKLEALDVAGGAPLAGIGTGTDSVPARACCMLD